MRTALISALTRDRHGSLLAEEVVASRALLAWQVDVALRLGCERVICLCDSPSSAVIAQQRRLENKGLAFHTARGPLQLVNLVRDTDDVFLLCDGLFLSAETATDLLTHEGELVSGIWTLPANHALASTFPDLFERIDRDRHWAGAAIIPGKCVHGLGDLPEDGDAVSLLLRLALQERTGCNAVPSQFLEGDDWVPAGDKAALERREAKMMSLSLPDQQWAGPISAGATEIVRRTGPLWLQSAPEGCGLSALLLGLIGAGLAWFGYAVPGLLVAAVAAFAAVLSANGRALRSALYTSVEDRIWQIGFPFVMLMLALVTLVMANSQEDDWLVRASLPVLALGLASINGQERSRQISAFWRDTPAHLLIFALFAGLGYLQESLIAFALAALLQLAVSSRKQ
ncbi:hypothetical protein MWU38_08850 [Qipengyuania sp. S6317L1]|uniref:hypothetical protein n=1 Tax=Qipengyuania sp. S6317L1 TaxID=2926410 RepID=UPI001FF370CE|nr:hypothetical protein [Qipengyuania sp. S6317L1]MCK0099490.1 hypothetical protein [Qipengyuania sp. S6317L1]